ncbi:MAG: PD-(D/E)XK nuclease domain-containing protein, partial [Bacteroidota bacterium]
ALTEHDLEAYFKILQSTISGFPYFLFSKDRDLEPGEVEPESTARERTYHMMLLSLFKGMGFSVAAEVPTSRGSIDLVIQLPSTTYVIEVKLNRNAALALAQIHAKGYHKAFLGQGKTVVLLGLNFSSKARNIDTWEAELLDAQGQSTRFIRPAGE